MSEKQLRLEKRAFLAYLQKLIILKKSGKRKEKGISIRQEIMQTKKHLENLEIMIKRKESEHEE